MAKEKRPTWFKLHLHQRSILDVVSDAEVGRGLKAALRYFDTGELTDLSPLEAAIFASFKPFVDEAVREYDTQVANGRKSAQRKKELKESQTPSPPLREEETEAETDEDIETEEKKNKREKDHISVFSHSAFVPPDVDQVRRYCEDNGFTIDPQRFVDYYSSIGWQIGKSRIVDWRATVRGWNSTERPKPKPAPDPDWDFGVTL